jgi:ubiquinone/menaquinone biosynthesis C-methylase UbiE
MTARLHGAKYHTRATRDYLPAAGHDWALPLYDIIVALVGGNPTRRILIDQAGIRSHERILEVGCGTGTVALSVKQTHPAVDVIGLDPDPRALARARRKADRAALAVRFDVGFAGRLPYADASFDRVLSSFMFHHLHEDEKERMLSEVRRVLQPAGSFHMVDFAGPDAAVEGPLSRRLHASHHFSSNRVDGILALMKEAGFTETQRVTTGTMLFGHLAVNYFRGA